LYGADRDLLPFPTRRSSDLAGTFHTRTVPFEPVAESIVPSGLNITRLTTLAGPANCARPEPSLAFHRRTDPSTLALATIEPSGLNATSVTIALCALISARRSPVAVSVRRTRPSALPVASSAPSSLNATLVTSVASASNSRAAAVRLAASYSHTPFEFATANQRPSADHAESYASCDWVSSTASSASCAAFVGLIGARSPPSCAVTITAPPSAAISASTVNIHPRRFTVFSPCTTAQNR